MKDTVARSALAVFVVLAAAWATASHVDRPKVVPANSQPVVARGSLADIEMSRIELFDRVSPSMVQIAGLKETHDLLSAGASEAGLQTGSGFLWEAEGDMVTNNHDVEGVDSIAVRLAYGDVFEARFSGTSSRSPMVRRSDAPPI